MYSSTHTHSFMTNKQINKNNNSTVYPLSDPLSLSSTQSSSQMHSNVYSQLKLCACTKTKIHETYFFVRYIQM